MAIDAYEEGSIARHEERPLSANPYPRDSGAYQEWRDGWFEEDDDIEECEYYDNEDLNEMHIMDENGTWDD